MRSKRYTLSMCRHPHPSTGVNVHATHRQCYLGPYSGYFSRPGKTPPRLTLHFYAEALRLLELRVSCLFYQVPFNLSRSSNCWCALPVFVVGFCALPLWHALYYSMYLWRTCSRIGAGVKALCTVGRTRRTRFLFTCICERMGVRSIPRVRTNEVRSE